MTGPDAPAAAPDVSIVICTRNRASTLGGTLRSLRRLRTAHGWEVLIVDSASSDETGRVLAAADDCGGRLSVLRLGTPGLGLARDAGWRAARGHIVAFTDDDCYLEPDYVDALLVVFDEHRDASCIGGRILLHDPADARVTVDERDEPVLHAPFRFANAGIVQGANMAFRRAALERSGGFDHGLGAGTPFPCEDIDAVASVLWDGGAVRFDPRPVVWHHHRRREADLEALWRGYDRGRGAYYAKYLLRPDTRRAYAAGWWHIARRYRHRWQVERLAREIGGAFRYLARRRAVPFLVLAAPFAGSALLFASLRTAGRALRHRLRRRLSQHFGTRRRARLSSARVRDPDRRDEGACHLSTDPVGMVGIGPDQPRPHGIAVPARAGGLDGDRSGDGRSDTFRLGIAGDGFD